MKGHNEVSGEAASLGEGRTWRSRMQTNLTFIPIVQAQIQEIALIRQSLYELESQHAKTRNE